MALDTSIYNSLLRPPKSVAEYDDENRARQVNALALQGEQIKAADAQRSIAAEAALSRALASGGDVQNQLAQAGFGSRGLAYTKSQQDIAKTAADVSHLDAQTGDLTQKTKTNAYDLERKKHDVALQEVTSFNTPADAIASLDAHIKRGEISAEEGAQMRQMIPNDPASFKKWQVQTVMGLLDAKERMAYTTPNANTVASNTQSDINSQRTAASSKYSADSSASTARRGQDLARLEPKGVIMQSDTGPLLVDPRTGASRPVMNPDGTTAEAKLKPLPAQVQKGLMENSAALRKVDAALAAIEKYPAALGAKNYLGDTITQRTDPKGVEARALVADIGSLKLHDRSGAAVTASETPRLKPFIPAATDDIDTVNKKLGLFKQEYQAIENEIRETYSREQGYKLPIKSGLAPSTASATAAEGAAVYSDAAKEARYQAYKRSQGK